MSDGSWGAWRDMVLREIGRQNRCLERLEETDADIRVEIGKLRVWAGIWGAAAGIGAAIGLQVLIAGGA